MTSYGDVPEEHIQNLAYFSLASVSFLCITAGTTIWLEHALRSKYSQFTPNLQDLAFSELGSALICLHFALRQMDSPLQLIEPVGSFFVVCFLLESANVQCKQYCGTEYQPFSKNLSNFNRAEQIATYGIPFLIDLVIAALMEFASLIDQFLTALMALDAVCSLIILYEATLLALSSLKTLAYARKMNITQSSYLEAVVTVLYVIGMVFGKLCYSAVVISATYVDWLFGWVMWAKDLFQEVCNLICAIIIIVDCYIVRQKIKFTYNLLNSDDTEYTSIM